MSASPLGPLTRDGDDITSQPIPVPLLGHACTFVISLDPQEVDGHLPRIVAAVARFLALDAGRRADLRPHLRNYYTDVVSQLGDGEYDVIPDAADILEHVRLGAEVWVHLDDHGVVHLSIEGNCDWEPEHGVQVVYRNGDELGKVSAYDGHLVNDDPAVIYERFPAVAKPPDPPAAPVVPTTLVFVAKWHSWRYQDMLTFTTAVQWMWGPATILLTDGWYRLETSAIPDDLLQQGMRHQPDQIVIEQRRW